MLALPSPDGPDSEMMIESPPGLLPNLAEWGIEEVDNGVCEDTYENRVAIRSNKGSWVSVFDQNGHPTGHLQVITAEMSNDALRFRKTSILQDPSDVNSDYMTGLNLLLVPEVNNVAPTWVLRRTKQFLKDEDEREALGNGGAVHPSRLIRTPSRCVARKGDGARCWMWYDGSINGDSVCNRHTPKAKRDLVKPDLIRLARARLESSVGGASDTLEELMRTATSETVRLGAAKEILDRAGIRGGIEVEQKVEVTVSASELLKERLDKLRENGEKREALMQLVESRQEQPKEIETVDAEVVEDDEEPFNVPD